MWKKRIAGLKRFIRNYSGRIAYYGGVAVVLTAIAFAAEHYRNGDDRELILPEPEVSTAVLYHKTEDEIILPEGMELLRPFSAEPEWNAEMGQWENHLACDYRVEGNVVRSMCAGTVEEAGESASLGGYVKIRSGDRLLCISSINPDGEISAGSKIRMGDVLGEADASLPGEEFLGKHVHLQVYEGETPVDFEGLLTKNSP